MKKPFQKLPESVVSLVTVFAVFIVVTIVVVKFVIPPRFKETSIQWADTVRRENARPVRLAGAGACAGGPGEGAAGERKGHPQPAGPEGAGPSPGARGVPWRAPDNALGFPSRPAQMRDVPHRAGQAPGLP